MKKINYKSVEIDGIDTNDYPDFCDAFICYAEWEDGTEMTEQEIEDNFDDDIDEYIANQIY